MDHLCTPEERSLTLGDPSSHVCATPLRSDLNYESLVFTEEQQKLFAEYVKSTRVRAARNISGFSLPAGSSKEDRLAVEQVFSHAWAGGG